MQDFAIKARAFQVMPIINSMMIKEARDKARLNQEKPMVAMTIEEWQMLHNQDMEQDANQDRI